MMTENIVVRREFSWIDIEHPLRPDFNFIEEEYHLPPLLVQDCLRPEHLPKYEKTNEGHFFLARIYDPKAEGKSITIQGLTNKVAIFISQNSVVTIHTDVIYSLRKFTELRDTPEFPTNIHQLTHQLFRLTILSYDDFILHLQALYEGFENDILSKNSASLSNTRVYHFRRQLYVIKGILQLTQNSLQNSKEFWYDHKSMLQDIKENIDHLYFRLDDLSHNFDQLFALYISINEQRSNDVMKILTIFASIMLPLTFISSFYGMNFDRIPGLHSVSGLVAVVMIMATITFMTIWFFNKKKWFKVSV